MEVIKGDLENTDFWFLTKYFYVLCGISGHFYFVSTIQGVFIDTVTPVSLTDNGAMSYMIKWQCCPRRELWNWTKNIRTRNNQDMCTWYLGCIWTKGGKFTDAYMHHSVYDICVMIICTYTSAFMYSFFYYSLCFVLCQRSRLKDG